MQETNKEIIIIGGGPAGMTAALFALKKGADVCLLEKNDKLGKKLYITGKGRCNMTNDCDINTFLEHIPRNSRFMYSAINFLSPQALMELFENLGCPTVLQRGSRVYPKSEKASDVTRTLARNIEKAEIHLNSDVKNINIEDNKIKGVTLYDGRFLPCKALVIATGGLSYPITGSTGDGYAFAKSAGLKVTKTSPSLVPINLDDEWVKPLSGLTLKQVAITAYKNKKRLYFRQGELLLTHFGISGPIALSLSAHITGENPKDIKLELDMKPALTEEMLITRLDRECMEFGAKTLKTNLKGYLPINMAEPFLSITGIDPNKKLAHLNSEERKLIAYTLKHIPLNFNSLRPFNEAVVTRGGVEVGEINPKTMQAKKISGLYFAGEVLDVDGYTGGFNLQIAFSTGALAGENAAEFILGR
ncbi:MAG: NAD(P)/FAD-dependent oxidoreductase [Eubacteriales bacterium]|nr:NAD(P)/FAD-dependent oxidoreductase [Eubacteriales bacterium]